MVLYRPDNALLAFGVAQLASHLFYTVVHYSYFYWYINNKLDTSEINKDTNFPFKSVSDFLPGQLNNNVINEIFNLSKPLKIREEI